MNDSTSVPTREGAHSLTPGEQRILTLMEQGQQRLEQRLQLLEDKLDAQGQQLKELELRAERKGTASRIRDMQLASDLQNLQGQLEQSLQKTQESMLTTLYFETNKLRTEFSERLERHNARLETVEQTLEQHGERIRDNTKALQGHATP
ncbi:hypothetical protein F0U61_00010 [Archangium violaceum]|uniref:hypothetical protein n=1 Tax=Archangium violaceum TaxID=83451 RepID=UPI002B2ACE53|nr:hypothetical protein F0U61_00010 [Archangium violaceum]